MIMSTWWFFLPELYYLMLFTCLGDWAFFAGFIYTSVFLGEVLPFIECTGPAASASTSSSSNATAEAVTANYFWGNLTKELSSHDHANVQGVTWPTNDMMSCNMTKAIVAFSVIGTAGLAFSGFALGFYCFDLIKARHGKGKGWAGAKSIYASEMESGWESPAS